MVTAFNRVVLKLLNLYTDFNLSYSYFSATWLATKHGWLPVLTLAGLTPAFNHTVEQNWIFLQMIFMKFAEIWKCRCAAPGKHVSPGLAPQCQVSEEESTAGAVSGESDLNLISVPDLSPCSSHHRSETRSGAERSARTLAPKEKKQHQKVS